MNLDVTWAKAWIRTSAAVMSEHRVELIKVGPGHTIGDAVAWLPKERILFTGDLCVNQRPGNNVADPDADPDNWVRALDALSLYEPAQVVPGHGALGGKQALTGQRGGDAGPLLAYYAPLREWLKEQNRGRTHTLPERAPVGMGMR